MTPRQIYASNIVLALLLIIINPTSYSIQVLLLGILFASFLSAPLLFSKYQIASSNDSCAPCRRLPKYASSAKLVLFLIIIEFCLYYVATYFYTGNSLFAINNSGYNSYLSYQVFFLNEISSKSIADKAFPIFSLTFAKIISSVVVLIGHLRLKSSSRPLIRLSSWATVGLGLLPMILFGLARGTSIEIATAFALLFFSSAWINQGTRKSKSLPVSILFILLFLLASAFFSINLASRYGEASATSALRDICITPNYCYSDPLVSLGPEIDILAFSLGGYFISPMYALGSFVSSIVSQYSTAVGSIFPLVLLDSYGLNPVDFYCKNFLDCGVQWKSGFIQVFPYLGLPLALTVYFLLGKYYLHFLRSRSLAGFVVSWFFALFLFFLPFNYQIINGSDLLLPLFFSFAFFFSGGSKIRVDFGNPTGYGESGMPGPSARQWSRDRRPGLR